MLACQLSMLVHIRSCDCVELKIDGTDWALPEAQNLYNSYEERDMRMIQMTVAPVNCQVALVVPDAEEEPPEWPTGREQLVANSGAIYVATICDVDGEVAIEVWLGEELPHQHLDAIYEGTLQVRDAGALVGSVTGNHLGFLTLLLEGEHRVRVYVDPPGAPADHVYFVID